MNFLSTPTLSLVALITSVLMPLVLLTTGTATRKDVAIATWVRGATLYSAGFIGLGLRGIAPDFLTIIIANVLILFGYAELLIGMRLFFQRPASHRLLFWALPPYVGLLLWLTYISPNQPLRILVFSVYLVVITMLIAREMFNSAREIKRQERAGSASEKHLMTTLAALFGVSAILLVLRVLVASIVATQPQLEGLSNALNASAYLVAITLNFMIAASLPLLVNQRTQRELAQSEQLLRRAQSLAKLGSLAINLKTGVVTANDVIHEMVGVTRRQSYTISDCLALLHPDDRSRIEERVLAQSRDHVTLAAVDYRIVRPSDGSTRWINAVSEFSKDPHDGSPLLLSTLRDVTDTYMTAMAAQRAIEAADAANRAKSEFLANMSHEIRTPLNGVIGMAQLLQYTGQDDEQSDYTRTIVSSAQALLTIVNDILDFSKVEAGRLEIDPAPFAPHELLADMRAIFTPQAKASDTVLDVQCAAPLPAVLVGDSSRLRQILSNLLGNAIKFTRGGRVTLNVSLGENEGKGAGAGNSDSTVQVVEFAISDTGIGMNEDTLNALFNPFFQADASITRRFGGTGLGLSISKRLAELMGGSISVRSQQGQGSVFTVRLPFLLKPGASALPFSDVRVLATPIAVPPALTLTPAASPVGTTSRPNQINQTNQTNQQIQGPHVLVVDDNHTNQMVARHMLERLGYQPTLADDGRQALSLLGAKPIAAILMDCQMPIMDGYEATRRIRAGEAGEHVRTTPIIAMTANAMAADRALCLDAGMDDFLAKPIVFDALKDSLIRWVPVQGALHGTDTPVTTHSVPATTTAIDVDKLAHFDAMCLMRYAMNDRDLAIVLVDAALVDIDSERKALGEALSVHDYAAANRHAHTLKGLTAHLGGELLSGRFRLIESALRPEADAETRTLELAASALSATDQACASFCAQVRTWRNSDASTPP